MAILGYVPIIAAIILCFLYYSIQRRLCCRNPFLTDWPIFGMLPPLLCNLWRIHDFITDLMKLRGTTGDFMGPWFTGMNYLITSDPINVHHIMSKNFENYVKGSEFREIFHVFGQGIFTTDSDIWRYNRSLLHSLFKNRSFENFLEKTVRNKVTGSLIPVLEHVLQNGGEVDLQDVFNRFTFDNICSIILGSDPNCLSIDFPEVECEKAFNEAEETILYRHVVPKIVWKMQRWLQIGQEKKMKKACEVFDRFIYSCIESKRKGLRKLTREEMADQAHHSDLLTTLITEQANGQNQMHHDEKFLRDSAFNLFVAGRDTITSALTWFFWLIATNPSVESKILEEINHNFGSKNNSEEIKNPNKVLGIEEVKKLVYLHAALCESLRLFPPIPFERKQPTKHDILPNGHHVNENTQILLSLYAMGRFEEIWGKDCLEFKPERWISEKGNIIHIPSYKFISFNAGPRTCLGKDLSFIQLKMVVSSILCNYCVKLVKGHQVIPSLSIVLLMKNGLKVRITKRES